MKFSDYFKSLNSSAQEIYASRAGTTANYIRVHLLAKRRIPRPALLDGLAQASQGKVSRDEILAHFYQRETDTSPITPPPPNRRQVPDRRTTDRRQEPTRRVEEATPGRRTGGERRQGERRAAEKAPQDQPKKPKPAPSAELRTGLSNDEACPFDSAQESPEPRRRGEADRAA